MPFSPKHILVPVAIDLEDEMGLAKSAVDAACDVAVKFASKITLLHLYTLVITGPGPGADVSGKVYQSLNQVLDMRKKRAHEKLEELGQMAKERGVFVESRVLSSLEATSDVLCEAADELQADLLVMASHGRHGLSRLMFGSVAEKVIQKTTIPILLLHPRETGDG